MPPHLPPETYDRWPGPRVPPHSWPRGSAEKPSARETASIGLARSYAHSQALRAGASAPDFTLRDHLGWPVSLSRLLAWGPVVLVFYQGLWCPYSDRQLRAFNRGLRRIQDLGAALLAISPQQPDHSLSAAEMLDLSFPVLRDPGNLVARRYGLMRAGDLAASRASHGGGLDAHVATAEDGGQDTGTRLIPGTFVVDQTGIIRLAFADPDVTRRLEVAAVLAVLNQLRS